MHLASKIFFGLGALLFSVFTALQFNDAAQYSNYDAWTWIFIYGIMAAISAALLVKPLEKQWLYAWGGFTWGCLLFRIQDEHGNVHFEWLHPANYWDATGTTMVQNSNESGGLLLLAFWATATVFMAKWSKKT